MKLSDDVKKQIVNEVSIPYRYSMKSQVDAGVCFT